MNQHDEAAVAQLREMADQAKDLDTKACIYGEKMLYLPHERALIPGHIYSESGVDEARVSSCCEYHFDKMFEPGWVDIVTGEKGDLYEDEEEDSDD
jgi:hypothetical protein